MEKLSYTEENYLKAIFKICEKSNKSASTNAIAKRMATSAASVTDMLQRLAGKLLINYEKYKGVTLTVLGGKIATNLVRKHRLWEVFLVEKLEFSWGAVHDIAEELEHIKSEELVERLDLFLGQPKFDPHGDPIPDVDGNFAFRKKNLLSELKKGEKGIVVGVQEHTASFLDYLDQLNLSLGVEIEVIDFFEYDESIKILLNQKETILSQKVSQNLFVQKG
ncbi:MAG: metal-dependent transcriptional regulator [Saprospiraceae bacterium]|jgi:DtxR family Mn-dependent transcriptional regulator|nr:metal-dependent transcriptional regulator [Saprospiraceae bacterium]